MNEETLNFLFEVIEAQAELLRCYRLGSQPSDFALDTLADYNDFMRGE